MFTGSQLTHLRSLPAANGNRLRVAREIAGLTQREVADRLDLTQSSLSDLERNRYGSTTVDTARKLADFYGCTIEDLFPRVEVAS